MFVDFCFVSNLLNTSSEDTLDSPRADSDDPAEYCMDQSINVNIPETPQASSQEALDKHVWQHSEVLCLIESMAVHFDDLSNVKKRRNVFENIANDMLSKGFPTNATLCKAKWKSLVRSYSAAVDNKNRTGRGPSRFQFFEEIDAILGTKPSQKCSHTLDTSINGLETDISDNRENILEDQIKDDEPNTNSEEGHRKNGEKTPNPNIEAPSNSQKCKGETVKNKRKRKNYEDYIKEKHIVQDRKDRRHQERIAIEREKLDIQKQKIALFKKYLEERNKQ